jgi:hypothetical protein
MLVLSGLDSCGKDHVKLTGAFLTGTAIENGVNGISVDQVIARQIGRGTRFASIELGTEPPLQGMAGDDPIALANTIGYIVSGSALSHLPEGALGYVWLPALAVIGACSVLTAPLGAKIAHFFLFKTFGWSTLLLIPLFYLSALKVGFKKEIYSLERLSWQVLFYILWLSLLAGFFVFSLDLPHSIGGGVGYFVNEKLYQLLGYLSIFVIGFGGFIFLVLFYQLNPKKAKVVAPVVNEEEVEDESLFIDEDGPAIHVDNDDIEEFRPIFPPVVEEVAPEPETMPEPEPEPLPVLAEAVEEVNF